MGEIVVRPQPEQALVFDGERFTTSFGGQTAIEHWHRYLLARELVRGRDVLDIACGEGYGSALLAQTARSVIGVDLSANAVAHAQASYGLPNLRYLAGDALAIPLDDCSADMVVSFETLEHFRAHDRFLKEIKRVLRPDGVLLISTPDRDNYSLFTTPPNPYHQLELTAQEFQTLLRRYFASITTQGQRVLLGSVLLGEGLAGRSALCFERRGEAHFEISAGLARAKYLIALASDGILPPFPESIYVDTDQLFQFDGPLLERCVAGQPTPEAAARINALAAENAELATSIRQCNKSLAGAEQERDRLASENTELRRRLDVVYHSPAWRLLGPFRRLGRFSGGGGRE